MKKQWNPVKVYYSGDLNIKIIQYFSNNEHNNIDLDLKMYKQIFTLSHKFMFISNCFCLRKLKS